jgi:hypothetical protein
MSHLYDCARLFSELTKHFSSERREKIEKKKELFRKDMEKGDNKKEADGALFWFLFYDLIHQILFWALSLCLPVGTVSSISN